MKQVILFIAVVALLAIGIPVAKKHSEIDNLSINPASKEVWGVPVNERSTFYCFEIHHAQKKKVRHVALGPILIGKRADILVYKNEDSGRMVLLLNPRCNFITYSHNVVLRELPKEIRRLSW